MIKNKKLLFLVDVMSLTLFSFGGPNAHISFLLRKFVQERKYLSEQELLELNTLSQIIPGPSSTQTLVGIAWKVGKTPLVLLTWLIWVLPSAISLIVIAIYYSEFQSLGTIKHIFNIIQPIALGIVAYSIYTFGHHALKDSTKWFLGIVSLCIALVIHNAYAFPVLLLLGGLFATRVYNSEKASDMEIKRLIVGINRAKLAYFLGALILLASLGFLIHRTSPFSLPIRLFENFYRNGILAFGGGQTLVSLMFTEFVTVKNYLSEADFLNGYALQQMLPGPTFSFSAFVGTLSVAKQGGNTLFQVLGGAFSLLGINLPGLILILFLVPFWDDVRRISRVKDFLGGINAIAVGFMVASIYFIYEEAYFSWLSVCISVLCFCILFFSKVSPIWLILTGILWSVLLPNFSL